MKANILSSIALSALVISGLSFNGKALAQADKEQPKKSTIRIKVTEDKAGKAKTIEKSYVLPEMSDPERDNFVDKALDSIKIDADGKSQVTITVDDGKGNKNEQKRRIKNRNKTDDDDIFAYHFNEDFNFEALKNKTKNFEREFTPKARIMIRDMENLGNRMGERMGDFWNSESAKASTVRELSAYPNNPDNGQLNLRFVVPQKGNVNIIISDTNGKEVGRKEIKDFSGDFIGQIDVKKNTKGTLFVTVTQNNDGAVKRVILP
jgi:hypothetical protein